MRALRTGVVGSLMVLATTACGSSGDSGAPTGAPSSPAQARSGSSAKVVTKLLSFEPKKLSVKAGTTVTWEVSDQIGHTVTTGTFTLGGDGLRSAEQPDGTVDMPLAKGKPVSFTFGEPGTYTYYCSIHKGMNGEVEVTP